ncbi:tRNA-binding protein [Streptomyces sp. NPDC059070]|uniref:tRNA-binding protein n=1 Tax=unclassified Streptomyces TaxID=2593676 RepID=UPI0034E294E1
MTDAPSRAVDSTDIGAGIGFGIDGFLAADIRVGRVLRAEDFSRAPKPAYKLWIDFGELGTLQSSAQITDLYDLDDLPGRTVLAVVNLPPQQVAGFLSEALVLGVPDENGRNAALITPDHHVEPGSRLM